MTIDEIENRLQEEKELSYNELLNIMNYCISEIKNIKSTIEKLTLDMSSDLKLLKGDK